MSECKRCTHAVEVDKDMDLWCDCGNPTAEGKCANYEDVDEKSRIKPAIEKALLEVVRLAYKIDALQERYRVRINTNPFYKRGDLLEVVVWDIVEHRAVNLWCGKDRCCASAVEVSLVTGAADRSWAHECEGDDCDLLKCDIHMIADKLREFAKRERIF